MSKNNSEPEEPDGSRKSIEKNCVKEVSALLDEKKLQYKVFNTIPKGIFLETKFKTKLEKYESKYTFIAPVNLERLSFQKVKNTFSSLSEKLYPRRAEKHPIVAQQKSMMIDSSNSSRMVFVYGLWQYNKDERELIKIIFCDSKHFDEIIKCFPDGIRFPKN